MMFVEKVEGVRWVVTLENLKTFLIADYWLLIVLLESESSK